MQGFFFISLFIIPVALALRRDFQRGLCAALAVFTFVSNALQVEGIGGGFDLTCQRLLLVLVLLFWLGWIGSHRPLAKVPFMGFMWSWWAANLVSLLFAKSFVLSLKSFISFSTEFFLFYIIIGTALTDAQTISRAFKAVCVSTAAIAILGVLEYYTNFNPFIDWMGIPMPKDEDDVLVGFKHRILFGYSMAMGWPLLLAWALTIRGRIKVIMLTLLVLASLAACYFSNSRGPWFGAVLATGIMYGLGTRQVRRLVYAGIALAVLATAVRPGIRATIVSLVDSTFDPNSYRGASYYYRKELWPVAWSLVSADPTRFLFGYGGLAVETMDLSDRFQYGGSTTHLGYTSWDVHYAADLVEFGVVGFVIELLFYGSALLKLLRLASRSPPDRRNMAAAIFTAAVVFIFAMTNVYMFAPQLKCLFLTLVIIGVRLPLVVATEEAHQQGDLADAEPQESWVEPLVDPEYGF